MSFHVPDEFRVLLGVNGSTSEYGNNGAFEVPHQQRILRIIASDGEDWEHVSVSLGNRCPNWPEMCFVKDIFWDDSDCVIQYHPSKSDYVNCHPYCLHLWRPINQEIPRPPSILVGPIMNEVEVKDESAG